MAGFAPFVRLLAFAASHVSQEQRDVGHPVRGILSVIGINQQPGWQIQQQLSRTDNRID